MKAKELYSNNYIKGGLLLIAGLLLGWLIFHSPAGETQPAVHNEHEQNAEEHATWTCSMHPQIRMDESGQCPICGMDLILLKTDAVVADDHAIGMSETAIKLAKVQTTIVVKGRLSKNLQLFGKIALNERRLQSQTAHVPGRLEKLLVNVTGEQVTYGQLLAKIYSPELITAQKELMEALALKAKYPSLLDAAREKLRNWKFSDKQIDELEKTGTPISDFPIYANTTGIVTALKVNEGDYVSRGTVLAEVADLSTVWAVFDAYESDLKWISKNQMIDFTAQALAGKTFSGKISFIDPVVNATTRATRIRVEVQNPDMELKPEMFINGSISATTKSSTDELIIPQSAVLWTGTRSIVYVKDPGTDQPTFKMREITLGPSLKNSWVVQNGLKEGEEIVTNGTFSVDAAAQLAGKPSMMNSEVGDSGTGKMHGMDMPMDKHEHQTNEEHAMFKVSGNCGMCKDRIEQAAKAVGGVISASWNADQQMVHLQFDPKKTSVDAIQKAIAAVGHDTEKYKTTKETYDALPGCCQYDRAPEKATMN